MTMYSLGVDLGTTFTAAATVDEAGVPTMVGLGNRAMQIPSVVHLGTDGSTLVGELAERQSVTDPATVAREFKRRMGDAVPIYVGNRPITAAALQGMVLRWVIDRTTERMGGPPSTVTVTHPATWTQFNLGKLAEAAELAGIPGVAMCSEPVAAATHYAATNTVAIGDRICIYDLGGGTFDVCVVVKTANGFEILGSPRGLEEVGGIDFDKLIIRAVHRGIASAHPGIDPDDPGYGLLRRECVDAKEALSVDVDTVIPVSLAGFCTSYRLTRSELESMIDATIELTITATRSALRSAGVTSGDLSAIVLVGGSSRIPLVSEKLAHTFKCRLAVNTHPKHEVALGAAMAGAPMPMSGQAADPPTRRARPAGRRRTALLSVSVLAAVVLAVLVVGRSLLLPSASAQSADSGALPTVPELRTSIETMASTVGTTAGEPVSTAPAGPPTSWSPPVTTGQADSMVAAPASLDPGSITWLRTLCGAGSRMDEEKVTPGASYPSVKAAQRAYADSYSRRADIARTTADALEQSGKPMVAGGRIDAEGAVDGLRRLAQILDDGGLLVADATVSTINDLTAADSAATDLLRQGYQPTDLQQLSSVELSFVASLPGCESLGG